MGNPRKWRSGTPDAPTAGPAPVKPPTQSRSHPWGMLHRYNEQGAIPAAKGAKPTKSSRKRRQ